MLLPWVTPGLIRASIGRVPLFQLVAESFMIESRTDQVTESAKEYLTFGPLSVFGIIQEYKYVNQ